MHVKKAPKLLEDCKTYEEGQRWLAEHADDHWDGIENVKVSWHIDKNGKRVNTSEHPSAAFRKVMGFFTKLWKAVSASIGGGSEPAVQTGPLI